jgi:hypothetical protein
MRLWIVRIAFTMILLVGCNSSGKSIETGMRIAVDQYLDTHGTSCIAVNGQFPIDVPASNWNDLAGQAAELAVLERAGLVESKNETATVQSLSSSLSLSPPKPQPVKRYGVSVQGKNFLHEVPTTFGKSAGFCYGKQRVDSIVSWTPPMTQGSYAGTVVTYTYKIPDLAGWAKLPEVEGAFPAVKTTLDGVGRNQTIGVNLTDKGWKVNSF